MMNKKKAISAIAAICLAAMMLSGCGGSDKPESSQAESPAAESSITESTEPESSPAEISVTDESQAESTGESAENQQDSGDASAESLPDSIAELAIESTVVIELEEHEAVGGL